MNKLMFCMIAGIMSLIGCGIPEPTGELLGSRRFLQADYHRREDVQVQGALYAPNGSP